MSTISDYSGAGLPQVPIDPAIAETAPAAAALPATNLGPTDTIALSPAQVQGEVQQQVIYKAPASQPQLALPANAATDQKPQASIPQGTQSKAAPPPSDVNVTVVTTTITPDIASSSTKTPPADISSAKTATPAPVTLQTPPPSQPPADVNTTNGAAATAGVQTTGYVNDPANSLQFMQNTVQLAEDTVKTQMMLVNQMPDGPDKFQMMDFLRAVSQAIQELQKILREMQAFDSGSARARSVAQQDSATDKLNTQLDAIKELAQKNADAAKKQATMDKLGMSNGAFQIVMTLVITLIMMPAIISAGPAGAVLLAVLLAVVISQIVKTAGGCDKDLMGYMMQGAQLAAEGMFPNDPHAQAIAAVVMKALFASVVVAVCLAAGPGVGLSVGASLITSAFSAGTFGSDIAKLAGADEKTQMWAEFASTCIVMVATMASAAGAIKAGLGVTKAAEDLGGIVGKLAQKAADISAKIGPKATAVIKYSTNPDIWGGVTNAGLSAASATYGWNYEHIQMDILNIQANLDSEVVQKDAIIAMLKEIIKKLLDAVNGVNSDLSVLNETMSKNYHNLSMNLPA